MYHHITTAISAYVPPDHYRGRPAVLGLWQHHDGAAVLTDLLQHTRRLHNRITDTFDPWVQALPFLGAAWEPDFKAERAKQLELLGIALLTAPHQGPDIVNAWVACAGGVGLHATFSPRGTTTTVLTPDNTDRLHHPAINELESLRASVLGIEPVQIHWAHDCWPWQVHTKCGNRNADCTCQVPTLPAIPDGNRAPRGPGSV